MSAKDDGGAAFPWCGDLNECQTINLGMTMRDVFAAAALPSIISDLYFRQKTAAVGYDEIGGEVADEAYAIADAMLKERAK